MDSTLLNIAGAIGVSLLGLLVWLMKNLISMLFKNTVQIEILNKHIEDLVRGYQKLEKIEKDLGEAHAKLREFKVKLNHGEI